MSGGSVQIAMRGGAGSMRDLGSSVSVVQVIDVWAGPFAVGCHEIFPSPTGISELRGYALGNTDVGSYLS